MALAHLTNALGKALASDMETGVFGPMSKAFMGDARFPEWRSAMRVNVPNGFKG